jgi:glucan phosphoethanolaminetransferase (alkaline phosphatase superfamily)
MVTLADYIAKLIDIGIFTQYLPFLIVFVIVYAVLTKTKIFGEQKRISGLIALIAALYVMTMGQTFGLFLASFFAGGSVILIFFLMFLMIVGLVVGERAWRSFETQKPLTGIFLVGIIIAVFLFYMSGGFDMLGITLPKFSGGLPSGIDQNTLIIIGVLVLTGLLIWWMIGGKDDVKGFEIMPKF